MTENMLIDGVKLNGHKKLPVLKMSAFLLGYTENGLCTFFIFQINIKTKNFRINLTNLKNTAPLPSPTPIPANLYKKDVYITNFFVT